MTSTWIDELERLNCVAVEIRHLPRHERVNIMIEKMAEIMKRGGRLPPELEERVEAHLAKIRRDKCY